MNDLLVEETEHTLARVNQLVTTLRNHRTAKDKLKTELSLLNAKIDALEAHIIEMLELSGVKSFNGEAATVTVSERTSVKIPRDPQSREAFFGFLRERGVYDALVTVNSQSLNAFYRTEEELAVERGDIGFQIPGLDPPTIYTELRVRAK